MPDALYHCNSRRPAPWADLANYHILTDVDTWLCCDLALNHPGDHVTHLDYLGLGNGDLWGHWNDQDHFAYAVSRPCEATDHTIPEISRMACPLPLGHPPGHWWEFADMPQ
ncbi:hypothetical protein LRE75_29100 [Streptomyces sp. 372A]